MFHKAEVYDEATLKKDRPVSSSKNEHSILSFKTKTLFPQVPSHQLPYSDLLHQASSTCLTPRTLTRSRWAWGRHINLNSWAL